MSEPRLLRARDVMKRDVITLRTETPITEVAKTFVDNKIGGAPVVDDEQRVIGIVTEGDLLLKASGAPGGVSRLAFFFFPPHVRDVDERLRRLEGHTAGDIMVRKVITCSEDAPVRELAALMGRNEIGRVPIVREGKLVGIVTRSDVLQIFMRPDAALVDDVREVLAQRMDVSELQVSADDGVVHVEGSVPRRSDVRAVEVSALSVDGAIGVDVSRVRYKRDDTG